MKIGIVRHFKVDYKAKTFMNSEDFIDYVNGYNNASVIENEVNLTKGMWNKCYCSDMPRAIKTAESIYDGEIIKSELLREVNMYPRRETKIRIPTLIWSITSRIAWKYNKESQKEGIDKTKERAKAFVQSLDLSSNDNILLVTHGFFSITLIGELRKLGFNGRIPKNMKNGYLYILEK